MILASVFRNIKLNTLINNLLCDKQMSLFKSTFISMRKNFREYILLFI